MNQSYVEPIIYLLGAAILFWVHIIARRALKEEGVQDTYKKKKIKRMTFFGAIACIIFFVIKVVTIVST